MSIIGSEAVTPDAAGSTGKVEHTAFTLHHAPYRSLATAPLPEPEDTAESSSFSASLLDRKRPPGQTGEMMETLDAITNRLPPRPLGRRGPRRRGEPLRGKRGRITPASADWDYAGFCLYRLGAGETAAEPTGDRESILVLVEGGAEIAAGGDRFGEIGDRMDVFERRRPWSVHIPNACEWSVRAACPTATSFTT